VYAASKIPNIHAVAIDPISVNSIATDNAYLIDNYIVAGAAPSVAHKLTERGMTGWQYEVTGPKLLTSPSSGTSQSTAAWISPLGTDPISRHSVDRQIDAIGAEAQLQRYQLTDGLR